MDVRPTLDRGKFPAANLSISYSKNKLISGEKCFFNQIHMMHADTGSCAFVLKALRAPNDVHHYFLPSPYPFLPEPWVLVLLLRRQRALAFTTLSTILDHGIKIHVSSTYRS